MEVKISFIIPCYNVERYIRHCLDTITAIDTRHNGKIGESEWGYEVICVLDPSTDSTLSILQSYADQNACVRIYQPESRLGIGGSRNFGLTHAKGEYIWYVDSDDSIVSSSVVEFLKQAEKEQLDVLAFNFNDLNEDGSILKKGRLFDNSSAQSGVDFVKNTFGDFLTNYIGFIWRFLYRREYLLENNILFPNGNWEDTIYMLKSMIMAERISSTAMVGYEYWHHDTSICRTLEKKYPGKLVYEFSFGAGYDLFRYADTIEDAYLNQLLHGIAIKDYFNWFPPYLCRSGYKERTVFYRYVKENYQERVKPTKQYLKLVPRLFLLPCVGRVFAECAAVVYNIKHYKKK